MFYVYNDWNNYHEDNVYADVYVLYARGVKIDNNDLRYGKYGVLVQSNSEASSVNGNKFSENDAASIAVRNGGTISDMRDNALLGAAPYVLYADNESTCNGTINADFKMGAGEKVNLKYKELPHVTSDLANIEGLRYKSSKKAVLKGGGSKLSAKKKGKAIARASWQRGNGTVNLEISVQVKKAPTKLKLGKKKITIKKGEKYQLTPKVNTACHTYTYKSSNNFHTSGYFSAMASSNIRDASLLILNSGVVFLRYLNVAADWADHKLILGFLFTSSFISFILSSVKLKVFESTLFWVFLDLDFLGFAFGFDLGLINASNPRPNALSAINYHLQVLLFLLLVLNML